MEGFVSVFYFFFPETELKIKYNVTVLSAAENE